MKVTTTTVEEVKIEPKLRKKLQAKLSAYAGLQEQLKPIKHAIAKVVAELDELRADLGVMSLDVDGNKITLVDARYKKFNPKKFVSLGGDLAIYNQAVEERPKKPFTKVTLKSDKADDETSGDE